MPAFAVKKNKVNFIYSRSFVLYLHRNWHFAALWLGVQTAEARLGPCRKYFFDVTEIIYKPF